MIGGGYIYNIPSSLIGISSGFRPVACVFNDYIYTYNNNLFDSSTYVSSIKATANWYVLEATFAPFVDVQTTVHLFTPDPTFTITPGTVFYKISIQASFMGIGSAYNPSTVSPGNPLSDTVFSSLFWANADGTQQGYMQSIAYYPFIHRVYILMVNAVNAGRCVKSAINHYPNLICEVNNKNIPLYTYQLLILSWSIVRGYTGTTLWPLPSLSLNDDTIIAKIYGNIVVSQNTQDIYAITAIVYMMFQSEDTFGASIIGQNFGNQVTSRLPTGVSLNWGIQRGTWSYTLATENYLPYYRLDLIKQSYDVVLLGTIEFPGYTVSPTSTCYLGQYFRKATLSTAYPGLSYTYPYYPNMTNFVMISQDLVFVYMINVQAAFCTDSSVTPVAGSNVLISITNYDASQINAAVPGQNQIPTSSVHYLLQFGSEFATMTPQPGTTLLYFTSDDGATVHKYDYATKKMITQPYATVMSYSPQYNYGLCDGKVQSTFLDTSYSSDFSFTCPKPNGYYYQSPGNWSSADPLCINMSPEELMTDCPSITTSYNALVSSTCQASYSKVCALSSQSNPPYSCTKVVPANVLQVISNSFSASQLAFVVLSALVAVWLTWYYSKSTYYVRDYVQPTPAVGTGISDAYPRGNEVLNVRNPSFKA